MKFKKKVYLGWSCEPKDVPYVNMANKQLYWLGVELCKKSICARKHNCKKYRITVEEIK